MSPRRSMDVLLVEDSPADVMLTREAFAAADFESELHVVGDGEKAMEFLHEEKVRPDLVLLDLNLPRKDGREVLTEMKADSRFSNIPVIVLSTSAAEEDVRHAYSAHVNSYVRKPVTFEKFLQAVQDLGKYWFGLVTLPQR